ncbi:MAG TPA: DUF2203 domain-containing protein [Gaiellaceae bacterium]
MSEMRFFTPEEANRELAVLRPLVERLVEERRALASLMEELEQERAVVAGNGGSLEPGRLPGLQDAASGAAAGLTKLMEEIDGLGVQVKDLDRGLMDFPARHPETGEPVLLCWELGEAAVAYWHGLEEGFAGRKPLPF